MLCLPIGKTRSKFTQLKDYSRNCNVLYNVTIGGWKDQFKFLSFFLSFFFVYLTSDVWIDLVSELSGFHYETGCYHELLQRYSYAVCCGLISLFPDNNISFYANIPRPSFMYWKLSSTSTFKNRKSLVTP